MQRQPDKEFDAKLREKMQGFSAKPPADLWGAIETEVRPPGGKGKARSLAWLKIAASVCLLAAAGGWLYNYEGPLENNIAVVSPGNDSLVKGTKANVTILNNSRQRDETGEEKKKEAGENQQGGQEKQTAGEMQAGEEKEARRGVEAERSAERPAERKTAKPEAGKAQATREEALNEATLASSVNVNRQPVEPLSLELAAVPHSAEAARPLTEVRQPSTEPRQTSAEPGRTSREPGTAAKNSLVPSAIRELSGVGEALNLVASAIDKSEDKFIQVDKDKQSGKWDGLSLDLGLVTISYNKPDKKKSDKN